MLENPSLFGLVRHIVTDQLLNKKKNSLLLFLFTLITSILSFEAFSKKNFIVVTSYCSLLLLVRVMTCYVYLSQNDSLSISKLLLAVKQSFSQLLPTSLLNLVLIILTYGSIFIGFLVFLGIGGAIGNPFIQKILIIFGIVAGITFSIFVYFLLEFNLYHSLIERLKVMSVFLNGLNTTKKYFWLCVKINLTSFLLQMIVMLMILGNIFYSISENPTAKSWLENIDIISLAIILSVTSFISMFVQLSLVSITVRSINYTKK